MSEANDRIEGTGAETPEGVDASDRRGIIDLNGTKFVRFDLAKARMQSLIAERDDWKAKAGSFARDTISLRSELETARKNQQAWYEAAEDRRNEILALGSRIVRMQQQGSTSSLKPKLEAAHREIAQLQKDLKVRGESQTYQKLKEENAELKRTIYRLKYPRASTVWNDYCTQLRYAEKFALDQNCAFCEHIMDEIIVNPRCPKHGTGKPLVGAVV